MKPTSAISHQAKPRPWRAILWALSSMLGLAGLVGLLLMGVTILVWQAFGGESFPEIRVKPVEEYRRSAPT